MSTDKAESVAKVVLTETLGLPTMRWLDLDRQFDFKGGEYLYTATPSHEWQDLSPLEMRDTLRNCAASTFDKLAPNWYEVRQFARAIEAALRTKNTGER